MNFHNKKQYNNLFYKQNNTYQNTTYDTKRYDYDYINFNYENYENTIITDKIKRQSHWQMGLRQVYFLNGIIRKNKPKKCLEIGVANGGSSILILNAIKDIENSSLVSLDLNNNMYLDSTKRTGYRVKKYFPELAKKWKLFTGDLPHKFLVKLNMKFDFLFLDTAHMAPGELLNFIEVLPFLKENAIMVLHDIIWHFHRKIKFYPSNIYLMTSINMEIKLCVNIKMEELIVLEQYFYILIKKNIILIIFYYYSHFGNICQQMLKLMI